jgi:taurine dioxygenase
VEKEDGMAARMMGTRLRGIDAGAVTDVQFAEVQRQLARHAVIVLPDQRMDSAALVAFSRRFGPLEVSLFKNSYTDETFPEITILSNLKVDGKQIGATQFGETWHTDFHFFERCGYATLLYGIEVPPVGSDTLFADMAAAYRALDPYLRARVDAVPRVLHAFRLRYPDQRLTAEQLARVPDIYHPLVRTHPHTGEDCLFLGNLPTVFPDGMSAADGQALMAELFAFSTQERFVYRHQWTAGDLLIWDNMSTLHKATPYDYEQHRRHVLRTSVIGERPWHAKAIAAQ